MNAIKKEYNNLVRQTGSNAIINIDTDEFNRYKAERERVLRLNQVSMDVEQLQKDMSDIKMLLQQLVNGK